MISEKAGNSLVYSDTKTIGKVRIHVKIRLDDECKNGHQDFSATGSGYEFYDGRWHESFGGCCHDEILKYFPELKPFVDLHLCDYKGAPTYAVENGFYWIKEYKSGKETADAPREYLRITDGELAVLSMCEDKYVFWFRLYELGIVKRWEEEAQKAIEYLESLTGKKFLMDSVKSQIEPLPAEIRLMIEERIANNYYSPEKIRERENAAKEEQKRKRISDLKEKATKDIKKIEDELSVRLHVIELGLPDDNLIYYNHTNTAVFNWQDNGYRSKVSQEQFIDFLDNVDYSGLPEGIKFELKQ